MWNYRSSAPLGGLWAPGGLRWVLGIDLKIVTQNATYLRFWLLRRNSVFNTPGRNVLVAGEEDEQDEEEEEELKEW